ncbi:MAG: ABC transporter ATP-binding protein [Verrucomicrobia bacterium]|nr:ABC transporter ATP-binding protein [Verrucomicrobiota bacterium]
MKATAGAGALEARSVRKSFGSQSVLQGLDLRIAAGDSVVIMGRSGCGKSVLLKHLIGLLQPDEGEVLVDGENLGDLDERALLRIRRKFGMVFQGSALFDSLSVEDNVAFLLRRERHLTDGEITRRVEEALERVELRGAQTKRPAELSGGMKKRVGLARAIVYHPEILLYDEPTTGLDPVVSDSIDRLIVRVCEEMHVTSVVVTHDMRSARRVGRRVVMLRDGRVYADGSPESVFGSPDPVVRKFVDGDSTSVDSMN